MGILQTGYVCHKRILSIGIITMVELKTPAAAPCSETVNRAGEDMANNRAFFAQKGTVVRVLPKFFSFSSEYYVLVLPLLTLKI